MECFRCGKNGRLFDAIGKEGIVKVCEECSQKDDIPVIRRPTTFQLKDVDSTNGVYERLSKIAGVDAREHRDKFSSERRKREELVRRQDTSLKELVDKNYREKVSERPVPREDLISNFHWIIMRARRMKKLTQEQLAKEIGESEAAIKMAEKGVLPGDENRLVGKLESFLGVRIRKKQHDEKPRELDIQTASSRELTIADLREMKALNETREMKEEFEEDIELNEEFRKKLEEELKKHGKQ